MALVRAADAAFPPPLSTLDDDVKVVLGYVGEPGYTPHIWTREQVDAVRASGRQWWAIVVPDQGGMSAQTGRNSARYMISVLPSYGHPKSAPVFFDVEYSSFEADSYGARAAVNAFVADMNAAGYFQAHGYVPRAMGTGWFANWSGEAPSSLPAGTVGQQYAGDTGGWDFSVFDKRLYDNDPQPGLEPTHDNDEELEDMVLFGLARTPDTSVYKVCYLSNTYAKIPNPDVLQQVKDMHARNYKPEQVLSFDTTNMDRFGSQVKWGQL